MALGGPIYLAAVKLRRMLSLSPTFQAAIGAADAPTALLRTAFKELSGTEPRPYGVVSSGEKLIYKQIAAGNQVVLQAQGSLFLYLARDVDPQDYDDDVQAELQAISFFGQVIDDIALLSAADDPDSADGTSHLSITNISLTNFGGNPEETWASLGRYLAAGFDVDWE
jgi:hypothetical protein